MGSQDKTGGGLGVGLEAPAEDAEHDEGRPDEHDDADFPTRDFHRMPLLEKASMQHRGSSTETLWTSTSRCQSPPLRVPRPRQTWTSMLEENQRTEPSAIAAFTPPRW